jgi:hypothetical protein
MSDTCLNPPYPEKERQARLRRLEALRTDLFRGIPSRQAYALSALLARLWIETGRERQAVACALCNYAPSLEKADAPLFVARLCRRIEPTPLRDDLPLPPATTTWTAWAGGMVAEVLSDALDVLTLALGAESPAREPTATELRVCQEALTLAWLLRERATVAPCLRLLRLLPPETAQKLPALSRVVTRLREAASRLLAAFEPELLAAFWTALRDRSAEYRRALLPVLDYVTDARALPELTRLLESRMDWPDGELVGWYVIRAVERIGDRRAIPALRRVATNSESLLGRREAWRSRTSPELILEARRILEALENGARSPEARALLRPAAEPSQQLLRPAVFDSAPEASAELLHPIDRHTGP